MSRKPNRSKEQIIQSVYGTVMSQPMERDQNLAAMLMKSYGQGIDVGKKIAIAQQKQDKSQKRPA